MKPVSTWSLAALAVRGLVTMIAALAAATYELDHPARGELAVFIEFAPFLLCALGIIWFQNGVWGLDALHRQREKGSEECPVTISKPIVTLRRGK